MFTERTKSQGGLILIGGPSGVGKSSVVEAISLSPGYERLASLTTREPRGECDREYEFVTPAEMTQLNAAGMLATVDEVYGNLYAVPKSGIDSVAERGVVGVKEVHPENFTGLMHQGLRVLTVVILPEGRELPARSVMRTDADASYYAEARRLTQIADLVLYAGGSISPAELAAEITSAYTAVAGQDEFDCRSSDAATTSGYDAIAAEFTDELRLTTADFHASSTHQLARALSKIPDGSRVLEVGAGRGWLAQHADMSRFQYVVQESSEKMASHLAAGAVIAPLRALPFRSASFDAVVGSLVDGMAYPLGIWCLGRLLKQNGSIILTWPSAEWTQGRSRTAETQFIGSSGGTVSGIASFTPDRDQARRLFAGCGITLEAWVDCRPIAAASDSFSPDVYRSDGTLPNSLVSLAVGRRA